MGFQRPRATLKPLSEIMEIFEAARCALGFHDNIEEVQTRHGYPVRIKETCRNCGHEAFTILIEG